MPGAFRVYEDPENDQDIFFETIGASIPENQLKLRDEIAAALTILRIIISDPARFRQYFRQLLSLAQAGLVGENANPELASRALIELKQDVTAREAGRIKNNYMKVLGKHAFVLAAILLVFWAIVHGILLYGFHFTSVFVSNLFRFEIGTMTGVWLSFGTRKPVLTFEDLHILEEDRMEPLIRLLFAASLALVVALAFHLKVVSINLGSLSTERIDTDAWAALFFGLVSGIGEKALSTNVSRQASVLLKP